MWTLSRLSRFAAIEGSIASPRRAVSKFALPRDLRCVDMPHYFFDLTDDKTIHDFKGKQLPNLKAARQHAVAIARDLINTKSTLLREPLSAWSISVKDGKFQKLLSVPVSDVMPAPSQSGVSSGTTRDG
jgi:hypothetical protein